MQLTSINKLSSEMTPPVAQVERVVTADHVNGSAVRTRAGDALGTIDRLLIDKVSGKITYAVIAIAAGPDGDRRQPLPWCVMTYDPLMGGYLVNLDQRVSRTDRPFGATRTSTGTASLSIAGCTTTTEFRISGFETQERGLAA